MWGQRGQVPFITARSVLRSQSSCILTSKEYVILFVKICLFILWANYRTEIATQRLEVQFCVKGYQHTFWSSLTRCVTLLSASILLGLPFRLIEGLVFGLSTLHCDFTPIQFLAAQSNSFVQVFSIGKVNIAKPWTENNAELIKVQKKVVQDHPKTCGKKQPNGSGSLLCLHCDTTLYLHYCWGGIASMLMYGTWNMPQATTKQETTIKSIPLQVTVTAMPVLFK